MPGLVGRGNFKFARSALTSATDSWMTHSQGCAESPKGAVRSYSRSAATVRAGQTPLPKPHAEPELPSIRRPKTQT